MVFTQIKVLKNRSYFKSFQVKYRRRREGKTDYRARKRLIIQDKTKYNAPKYRFVVRFTNSDVICQFVAAQINGDKVVAAAYSHELPRYGVPVGLTNYAAAYATGLLAARRVLTKLHLADKYVGVKDADGKMYEVAEMDNGPRPFKAALDVGLTRTTTGNRVFGAMKGAVDGGVLIKHSDRRFVGYDSETKKFDPEILKKYIFGGHVADYFRTLQDENPEKCKKQFGEYLKHKINPDGIEEMYKKCHAAIRAHPEHVARKVPPPEKAYKVKQHRPRMTLSQRKDRIKQKTQSFDAKMAASNVTGPVAEKK